MVITTPRSALLQAVQRCQNIVEKRHTIPILGNVLLHAEKDFLQMTATDLEVGIQTRIAAEVETPGSLTLAARKLFDIVRELDPDARVTLKADNGFASIQSGRSRFKLSSLPAEDYPTLTEEETGTSISIDGQKLASMIAATSFAMSHDETRRYLTGTLFEVDKQNNLRLVATDGHRLAVSETRLEQGTAPCQCIVPRKAVTELRRLCEEYGSVATLFLGERQTRLQIDSDQLVSKLIDAKFPNYQDVIPVGNPNVALIPRSEFDQVLRRSMIVANEFTHDLHLRFQAGNLQVEARNTEQEEAREQLDIEYSGSDLEIGFNGRYLRDALNAISSDVVRFELKDALSPALLFGEGQERERYVVMPMRI